MYDLAVRGYADFMGRTAMHSQQRVARDPLSGLVDGANTIFFTTYAPLMTSGSLAVRVGNTLVGGTADYDTGEIALSTPPTQQPAATYTHTPYTTRQAIQILISGFRKMEMVYSRGWRLVDALGNTATEDSLNLYVVSSSGSSPVCGGGVLFENSPLHVGFYQLCVLSVLAETEGIASAIGDFDLRESRGMSVDKSRRPSNLRRAVAEIDDMIDTALVQVMDDYETGGDHFGGAVHDPHTAMYLAGYEWQTDARSGYSYAVSRRLLCV